ncbi:Phage terminase large subunit [compost metagenome]
MEGGPGALHFANDLPDDFFAQCVAERKVTRYIKGYKKIEWVKGKAERNEALDLMVYSLAMAHYLGLNRYKEHDWERVRSALMQTAPPGEKAIAVEHVRAPAPSPQQPPDPVPPPAKPATAPLPIARPPQRRTSSSGYLKKRR